MGDGPSRRHQRRPQSALSQRHPLRGADLQYAAREHRGRERRPRPLRAGDLDDQAADAEPRAALRLFQLVDPGPDGAGRPLRAGALVRRRRQPPELEGRHRPPGRRLRPVRRRQDRGQGQYRSVHAVGGVGLRGDLQSADSRYRHPLLDRHQPRRHRAGKRARPDQQPDLRRAAQPEPGSGHQAALSVGVRHRRAARAAAGCGADGELQQAVVPRQALDRQPRHRAVRLHPVYRPGSRGRSLPARRCRSTASAGPATVSSDP